MTDEQKVSQMVDAVIGYAVAEPSLRIAAQGVIRHLVLADSRCLPAPSTVAAHDCGIVLVYYNDGRKLLYEYGLSGDCDMTEFDTSGKVVAMETIPVEWPLPGGGECE